MVGIVSYWHPISQFISGNLILDRHHISLEDFLSGRCRFVNAEFACTGTSITFQVTLMQADLAQLGCMVITTMS